MPEGLAAVGWDRCGRDVEVGIESRPGVVKEVDIADVQERARDPGEARAERPQKCALDVFRHLGEARAGGTQQQQNFEVAKHGRADQYEIRDGEPEALHVREARVLKGYVEEQEHKEWLAEESSVLWMTATRKGKA